MHSTRHLVAIVFAVSVAAAGCGDLTSPPPPSESISPEAWPPSLAVVAAAPAVCGDPTEVGLMLGPDIRSGSVQVTNDEANLYVTFRSESGRPILATAVFVGDSPDQIPTTRRGFPRLFRFPYKSGHRQRGTEIVWEIPLTDVSADEAVIAAFAQVGLAPSWGEGEPITPDRHWAMYFTHPLATCGAETVGPDGGTVSTADQRATISVPAGALSDDVDITIEPATVEDLLEHVGGGPAVAGPAAVAPLPSINGVTPIAHAIWDFGPDGTQFEIPATVTLAYDEADLPDGVDETELGAFIINGIFEPLPSTIDTDANTITAAVGHFSFIFAAVQSGVLLDLEMMPLTPPDVPRVDTPTDVLARVRNNGPGLSAGARVVYEASGSALLGEVHESCTEVPEPSFGDLAIRCDVPGLDVGEIGAVAPFQIIPQAAGGSITVRATVIAGQNATDLAPDNDQEGLAFSVVGDVSADLHLGLQIAPGTQPRVGGQLGYTSVINNLGPASSSGGTLRLEAFGDVTHNGPGALCTEVADPAPATIAIECDVEPLAVYDFTGIGPWWIFPQSAGDVEVVATVIPAPGETDPDPANDQRVSTFSIGTTIQVDLEPFSERIIGPAEIGEPLSFQAEVHNWGPHPSNGGAMIYEATGDVVLGTLGDSCTALPDPSVVGVSCAFEIPSGPVGPFVVIPQGDGIVTFTGTAVPTTGDVDVNHDNDQVELTTRVGPPPLTDLASSLTLSQGSQSVVGAPMDFLAEVTNLGPDASSGAVLTITAFGDVLIGDVAGSCTETPDPGVVIVTCNVASLAVGQTDGNGRLQIIPQSEGLVTILTSVTAAVGEFDGNSANNSVLLQFPVGPPAG